MDEKSKYEVYKQTHLMDLERQRLNDAIASKGGRCEECGQTEKLLLAPPENLLAGLQHTEFWKFDDEKFWAEVESHVLLCEKCRLTFDLSRYKCGTIKKYRKGCRCKMCTGVYENRLGQRRVADWD